MGETILLLKLESPMQSWGTRSRWDIRDTGFEPTKSGVVGLLGCAMGISRNDLALEDLDKALLFGVRIDRPGLIATDYHTVTGYHRTAEGKFKCAENRMFDSLSKAIEHKEATIVSPRDYLHDASFLVALAVKQEKKTANPNILEMLAAKLKNPKWPLYLGRKSCVPTLPIFYKLVDEYQNIEEAVKKEKILVSRSPRCETPAVIDAWIENDDGDQERQDVLRINRLRFYDFRNCKRIPVKTEGIEKVRWEDIK